MKRLFSVLSVLLASLTLMPGAFAQKPATQTNPPVAGGSSLGVTVTQMEQVVVGWSAKRDLLGKTVINDKKEKIGKIEDIIITPAGGAEKLPYASVAIISAGGFLGMGKHDVAIPTDQIKIEGTNLVLAGATKDTLKAMPAFQYAKKR